MFLFKLEWAEDDQRKINATHRSSIISVGVGECSQRVHMAYFFGWDEVSMLLTYWQWVVSVCLISFVQATHQSSALAALWLSLLYSDIYVV